MRRSPFRLVSAAARGAVAIAVAVTLGEGCRAPTEVIVEIDSDVPCAELQGVDIIVAQEQSVAEQHVSDRYSATSTRACEPRPGGGGHIGTIVVTPAGNRGAIVVIAGLNALSRVCQPPAYAGCIVARRAFSFIDHVTLHLPIVLDRVCLDVPCNDLSTCSGPRKDCVKSSVSCVESGSCGPPGTTAGGTPELVDAGPRADAPSDGATSDGPPPVDADPPPPDGAPPPDAGGAFCPPGFACPLVPMPGQVMCSAAPQARRTCCYDGVSPNNARCDTPGNCPGLPHACCNSRTNCGGGWCCSSTAVFTQGTDVSCHPAPDCATYICSQQMPISPECPPAAPHCKDPIGPPGFYTCSP